MCLEISEDPPKKYKIKFKNTKLFFESIFVQDLCLPMMRLIAKAHHQFYPSLSLEIYIDLPVSR